HAWVAVQLAVDLADLFGEFVVGARPRARTVGQPPVVALAGHTELVAHERDRVLLVGCPVRDRRVLHGWSFANQVATFFAKSRSIFSRAFSARNFSNSARSSWLTSASGPRLASRAFLTHLPRVISCTPMVLATLAFVRPE